MANSDFEEITSTGLADGSDPRLNMGDVAIRPDEEEDDAPGLEIWQDREREFNKSLDGLFKTYQSDISMRATALSDESARRMRRYKITRVLVITLLLSSLAALTFSSGILSGDYLIAAAKSTPVIVIFASLLYVIEAFLRDYEVATETAVAAEKLIRLLRKFQFDWTIAHDSPNKKEDVLRAMSESDIEIRNILQAEKAISVENIRSMLASMDQDKSPLPPPVSPR